MKRKKLWRCSNGQRYGYFQKPCNNCLIKELSKTHPGKQIGETIVQKIIFLLVEKGVFHFDYSMFYRGPYSGEVAFELDYAENLGIVDITWKNNLGYFICPGEKINHFENLLSKNEKKQINQVVKDYGDLSAVELSILASSIFVRTRFNTPEEELPTVIQSIKPKYSLHFIENIINKQKMNRTYHPS